MIESLVASQAALVGGVLLWASSVKLFRRSAPAAARRTALGRLVGAGRVVSAYRAVGCVELVLGAVLVLPPAYPAEAVLAAAWCAGMLGYLGYAKVVAPESSCGCLGDKSMPVRWRGFARAGLLLVASGFAVVASQWWVTALADRPLVTVTTLVVGFALVVALSEELDRHWLLPLRRWRVRLRHPLGSSSRDGDVPLQHTVQQLHKSTAYGTMVASLRSGLVDSWDEGDWRILTYSAQAESGPATAVFAVPRTTYDPDQVRVVLVPDTAEEPIAAEPQ